MRKQLVLMSIILAVFFLNSCAAVPVMIAGSGTLACAAYEDASEERCPVLVEIDEQLKNIDEQLQN